MLNLYTRVQAAFASDKGATAVEYGLMVALIAAAIMVTVGLLGGQVNTIFESVRLKMGGVATP